LLSEVSSTNLDFDIVHLIAQLGIKEFFLLRMGFVQFSDPLKIDLPGLP
jgi:hypothetical protein